MTKDMTVGKPLPILLKFSLPMLLSMAFQQLYSIADSVVIGQFLGDEAFAAVSASYPVTVLFIAFANGASLGCSVVTSQLFGAKRMGEMKTAAFTSLLSMLAIGAALSVIGFVCCEPLLALMNTKPEIFDMAVLYLMIYTGNVIFLFLYNTANAIFTALGDSLTPLYLLIASSVLNVGLDVLFVWPFGWGVAGAAWATFAAQGLVSLIAGALLLRRMHAVRVPEGYRLFDRRVFVRILRIGVPSVCQQSFVSVGQLFVQSVINAFPIAVQSGYAGAFKINIFTISCINMMGNSLSSYVAQNTGAEEWKRIRDGRRAALLMTWIFSAVITVLTMVFAGPLMSMFTAGQEAQAVGQQFLWTVSPFYVIITVKIINDGVFRGTGSMTVFMLCTFLDLGLRVIGAFVLPPLIGYSGVWWAFPLGWTTCTVLSVLLYWFGRWRNAADIRQKQADAM